MEHRLMRHFAYDHLPARLQRVSRPFYELARLIAVDQFCTDEAERTVALRKLLEAKNAAVRSVLRSRARHEALVAAAMLGIVKANGWMEMPITIDVNRALEAAGPVRVERAEAVSFTRGLIDKACEANDWELPDFSTEDERTLELFLGRAYDELTRSVL